MKLKPREPGVRNQVILEGKEKHRISVSWDLTGNCALGPDKFR